MSEYNEDQVGAVLVFKQGVTEEQAKEAIKRLKDVLSYEPNVHSFDPKWGGPVWYIP